jgi:hypothetical protein
MLCKLEKQLQEWFIIVAHDTQLHIVVKWLVAKGNFSFHVKKSSTFQGQLQICKYIV